MNKTKLICIAAIVGSSFGLLSMALGKTPAANIKGTWHLQSPPPFSKESVVSLTHVTEESLHLDNTQVTGTWGGQRVTGHFYQGNFVLVTMFEEVGMHRVWLIIGKAETDGVSRNLTPTTGAILQGTVYEVGFSGGKRIPLASGRWKSTPFQATR